MGRSGIVIEMKADARTQREGGKEVETGLNVVIIKVIGRCVVRPIH